jgi:hypothetical protein
MPSFVFILRDFMLDLIDENEQKITSNQYLEKSLRDISIFGKYASITNIVRHKLQQYFPDRKCFTLVRPVADEEELQ